MAVSVEGNRSPEHTLHPGDASWLFRDRTLQSRRLLEDALEASKKHGDDWAEHAFGRRRRSKRLLPPDLPGSFSRTCGGTWRTPGSW